MSSRNRTWCVSPVRRFDPKLDLCHLQDEPFHIPQAQAYCNGEWSTWDPKITTPPGLYVSYSPRDLVILTCILQIRVKRYSEAVHYLQMQLTYLTVNTAVDFTGTPVCHDAFTLLP